MFNVKTKNFKIYAIEDYNNSYKEFEFTNKNFVYEISSNTGLGLWDKKRAYLFDSKDIKKILNSYLRSFKSNKDEIDDFIVYNYNKLQDTDFIDKFGYQVSHFVEFRCNFDNQYFNFLNKASPKPGYPIVFKDDSNNYVRLKFNEDMSSVVEKLNSMVKDTINKSGITFMQHTFSNYCKNNKFFTKPLSTKPDTFIQEILKYKTVDEKILILTEYELQELFVYSKYLDCQDPYKQYCTDKNISKNKSLNNLEDSWSGFEYQSKKEFLSKVESAKSIRDKINLSENVYCPFTFMVEDNKPFSHVTLCEINNKSFVKEITIYDSLLSVMNAGSYRRNLKSALNTFAENYKNSLNLKLELSKNTKSMGFQAPLQTDCGRYVTIWLLAIVNGIDFKQLDNYPTLFEPLINLAKTRFFEGEKFRTDMI